MNRVGIIGLGTMGRVLTRGIARAGENISVVGTTRSTATAKQAAHELGIDVGIDNVSVAKATETLVLCVKPYQARHILESLTGVLDERHLIVSICAAVTLADLRAWSGADSALVRAMPNTPCLVGEGMTVFAAAPGVDPARLEGIVRLFAPLGRTALVDEELMDGVTGLSGCGPAYGYLIIEALAEAGVKLGIARATSTLLAAQTMLGAAKMVLERGVHPAELKDEVTTPAGCTIDGLMALEDGKLRSTLMAGVVAAASRSRALRNA